MKSTYERLIRYSILYMFIANVSIVVGESGLDDNSQANSICCIVSNANRYDGKEIVIGGVYRMLFHGAILMGSKSCPSNEINLRLASDYKADKSVAAMLSSLANESESVYKADKSATAKLSSLAKGKEPVDVVLRGIFRVAKMGECFGQICARYELEIYELLSARPYGSTDEEALGNCSE